ncbi:MAG TPA: alpha/beta hydrolase [Rhodanobacteraceae bacterium]|nr:alpha/beta hydrolase [Rhodanobacteraceae bacterium]
MYRQPLPTFAAALLAVCLLFVASGAGAATFRQGFVTVSDGVRIHYVDGGLHDGPVLLFIPGWTMDTSVWQEQMQHFAPTYRVVAIDPRSQGESSKTPDGNTPEQRAHDLASLMDQLKLEHVVLIGWSQGVQDVAAYVAQSGTARLDGIVLVDAAVSSGPDFPGVQPQAAKRILGHMAIYAAQPRAYLQGMMQAIFRKPLGANEMKRMVDGSMRTPTSTGIAMLTTDMFAVDRRPALAKFDKPTLIIAAGTSFELADQKAEVKRMPDARAVVIRDAGHAVFHDRPQAFERALREFLATLTPRPAN